MSLVIPHTTCSSFLNSEFYLFFLQTTVLKNVSVKSVKQRYSKVVTALIGAPNHEETWGGGMELYI